MSSFLYIQTPPELEAVIGKLLQKPKMTIALDTETTGLDPLAARSRVLLCQIATADGDTFVINAAKLDLRPLQPVFLGGRVALLQNAKFDVKWLLAKYGLRVPHLYDTMLAELLLNAGRIVQTGARRSAASLKSLAKRYLDVEMEKEVRKEFIGYIGREFTFEQLQYAADDVPILFDIKEKQLAELNYAGLLKVAQLEFQTVYPVARMELNGLGIDRTRYQAVVEESRVNKAVADAHVRSYLRKHDIGINLLEEVGTNIDSPKQLLEVFQILGCPLESTDSKHLKKSGHPLAKLLLQYREWETQVSTFGEPVLTRIHPVTGRIHAEFEQLGTDSGRFSCNKPNLQQIPADARFRGNFVPSEGNRMVVGDWSQFELRILCYHSGDTNMLQAFEAGRDLHSDTAARMYGLKYEEVTKKHPARNDAKILNFALAYGMGPQSLADSLGCDVDQAKEKMERYFQAYPGVERYLEESGQKGLRNLETRTVSGRRRLFQQPEEGPDYKKHAAAIRRQSKNGPIQGANGDALKRAMVHVQRQLDAGGVTPGFVACVHDEIVLEVPEGEAEWAAEMLEGCMVEAGTHYLPGVPIRADVGIATCWQK